MSTPIRVLHCGDAYLGSPFAGVKARSSERSRHDARQTMKTVLRYVAEQHIDIVLLSGNLLDFDYVPYDTALVLMEEIERIKDTHFFISPGKYDACEKDSFYRVYAMPENCHVFLGDLERIYLPEKGVAVYGWGMGGSKTGLCPLERPLPRQEGEISLVCGYVDGDMQSGICVTPEHIAESGAAYVGLSCGESFDGFTQLGNTLFAVSGPLEAGSFMDKGFGGGNLIRIYTEPVDQAELQTEKEGEEEEKQLSIFEDEADETPSKDEQNGEIPLPIFQVGGVNVDVERLLFGERRYVTEVLDISHFSKPEEIEATLRRIVQEKDYGKETALCIIYEGQTTPDFFPPIFHDEASWGLAELITIDKSIPSQGAGEYAKDMSIRGELVRAMMPVITGGDEKSKENAIKALRIAFTALDNGDISHV